MKKNKLIKKYSYDSKKIIDFKNIVKKEVLRMNKKFDGNLSNIHKYIKKDQINTLRLKSFKQINSVNWIKIIEKIALARLKENLGPDLLIQSKINLSIQIPNDDNSLLPAHSDSWSSDTPYQINLWLPLTDSFASNSMFIFDKTYSIKIFKQIIKKSELKIKKPKIYDFIKIKEGEFLLFNPACLHGNVINKTKKTRVSLNVRFKSIFSPESKKISDRKFGTYYKKFKISENTEFGTEVLDIGLLK